MRELNERQRAFVVAMVEHPRITQGEAARKAGYIPSGSEGALRVHGHHLAHHPGIQAAVREVAALRLNSYSIMAAEAVARVLTDPEAENKDVLKAAGMLLDRSGFGAAQTINVNKTVNDQSGKAILGRIKELSDRLGVDASKLLQGPVAPVVDGEFSEVSGD